MKKNYGVAIINAQSLPAIQRERKKVSLFNNE